MFNLFEDEYEEKYTEKDLSFGFEFELSNIDKKMVIPEKLGKWEYSELDIINTSGDYANICADPRGETPPVGGEINTAPTRTIEEQHSILCEILNLSKDIDTCITSHSHVHIHVNGLEGDIDSLKNILNYFYNNQESIFGYVYQFNDSLIPNTKDFSKIRNYLKYDGARRIPEWLVKNIKDVKNLEGFLRAFSGGVSGEEKARPIRYGVNLYSLKNTRTIEFRFFRGTTDKKELFDILRFSRDLMLAALNNGKSVGELIYENDYQFPSMKFNEAQARGWLETKHPESRCLRKNREFTEVL